MRQRHRRSWRRHPATKALLAGRDYQFPGDYLKLQLDSGEIDFIVAGRRTSDRMRSGGPHRLRHFSISPRRRCENGESG